MDFDFDDDGDDNWGCVPPSELFVAGNRGKIPSLADLVADLSAKNGGAPKPPASLAFEKNQPLEFVPDQTTAEKKEGAKKGRKKLKMKDGKNVPESSREAQHSLRDISFEIEKLIASSAGGVDGAIRCGEELAVRLGAKPPRRKALNYKALKRQRAEEAKAAKLSASDGESALRQIAAAKNSKIQKRREKRSNKKRKN